MKITLVNKVKPFNHELLINFSVLFFYADHESEVQYPQSGHIFMFMIPAILTCSIHKAYLYKVVYLTAYKTHRHIRPYWQVRFRKKSF